MSTMRKMSNESTDSTIPSSNPSPDPAADAALLSGSPLFMPEDIQDSPPHSPDSLLLNKPFKPTLEGPKPGEKAEFRGKASGGVKGAEPQLWPQAQPHADARPLGGPHRGGADLTVVQTAPFDHVAAAPPPPEH